jgi:LacI family transcriptional regulator
VLCDDIEGTYQAVKYLISMGHKRIAFIGNILRAPRNTPIYSIECRMMGYMRAMQEAGYPYGDLLIANSGVLYITDGYAATRQLIDNQTPFTAIFCASDLVSIGVLKALNEAGLRIPEDVSVIGEESHMVSVMAPNLTTIRNYPEAMGAAAVRQIISIVNNPDALPMVCMLPMDFVVRESIAPPR